MLVITRYPQQSFTIGDDITVTILSASGPQIRVGIDAPKHLQIIRDNAVNKQARDGEGNGNR